MLAESKFRSKFKSKFTSRFDRGLLMAGTVMASSSRLPHWVTLGASADLDFIGERYSVEGLTPAFTDIPGATVSGGVNGTVVRDGVIVRTTALDDDFTGYADQAAAEAAGWTQEGTDWTFDAANDKWTFGGSGVRETLYRDFTTVIGDSYVVEVTFAGSGNAEVFINLSGGLGTKDVNLGFVVAGTHTLQFTATSTTTSVNVRPNTASTTELTSVTVSRADTLPRIGDDGLLVEGAATNKAYAGDVEPSQLLTPTSQTAFETAFPDLDAFDAGAGALFGVVDRSADIVGTEIASLLPNGRVYVIDNTSGSGVALINFAGLTGNTNQHTSSAWIWSDTATSINEIGFGLNPASAKNLTSNVTASPQRFAYTETPSDTNRKLQVSVAVGHRAYFVLPQLEEGSTATSYIPTEGSSVTRTADSVTLTDLDALGLTPAVLGELDVPLDDDFISYADQAAAETAGWVFEGDSTIDAANDELDVITASGPVRGAVYRTFTTVAGSTYRLVVNIASVTSGTVAVEVFDGSSPSSAFGGDIAGGIFSGSTGDRVVVFEAESTETTVMVRTSNAAGNEAAVGSASVSRAEPLGGYTVVVEWEGIASNARVFSISDGTSSNRIEAQESGGNITAPVIAGGVNQNGPALGAAASGQSKLALSCQPGSVVGSLNGGAASSSAAGLTLPEVDLLRLGERAQGGALLNGFISRLTIIPRPVSDAELQALSS